MGPPVKGPTTLPCTLLSRPVPSGPYIYRSPCTQSTGYLREDHEDTVNLSLSTREVSTTGNIMLHKVLAASEHNAIKINIRAVIFNHNLGALKMSLA